MTTTIKKSLAAVALLGALAFGATTAGAAENNLAALTAQLAALQAQIASLTGGSSCSSYTHTVTLRRGSMGSQVSAMQAVIGASADGNFGPATEAKVKAFQMSKGLTADGVVGPNTGASISAAGSMNCGGDDDNGDDDNGDDDNGPLSGGAGSITVSSLSDYSNEEVGEDEEDVAVLAFEVEADDESDVEITSVKVEFVQGTAADSENLDDYAQSVSIWYDGEMVGEADAEDFNENSDIWTKSISLDDTIIRAGDTEEITVAVTAVGSLDSGDIDTDAWVADVLNVRFEDGDGVVTTEDTDADALEKSFDFAAFASSADLEFKVTAGDADDTVNEAHVINIDATDDTEDVDILSFNVEIEGDSDVNVESLPINVTVATQDNVDEMVSGLSLYMDGEKVGTINMTVDGVEDADGVSVGTTETYVFEDLDLDLTAGDDYEFLVKADIYGITDTGDVAAGDTIYATFGETQMDLAGFDATDESGEDLGDADETGTVTSDASEVRDIGFNVELVDTDAYISHAGDIANTTDSDQGTFVITFDVTAFDGDVYIDGTKPIEGGGATMSSLTVVGTDTYVDSNITSPSGATMTGTINADSRFKVAEDETERFTITFTTTAGADGLFQVSLANILYALTDVDGDLTFSFGLEDFDTESISMQNDAA